MQVATGEEAAGIQQVKQKLATARKIARMVMILTVTPKQHAFTYCFLEHHKCLGHMSNKKLQREAGVVHLLTAVLPAHCTWLAALGGASRKDKQSWSLLEARLRDLSTAVPDAQAKPDYI